MLHLKYLALGLFFFFNNLCNHISSANLLFRLTFILSALLLTSLINCSSSSLTRSSGLGAVNKALCFLRISWTFSWIPWIFCWIVSIYNMKDYHQQYFYFLKHHWKKKQLYFIKLQNKWIISVVNWCYFSKNICI